MTEPPEERAVAAATRTLALLNEQADGVRAELVELKRNLADAEREFSGLVAAQLLEANEQLVLAALHAETIAETAVGNLDALARISQRDALTDTPNRALMLDRLENAIAMAERHGTRVAVLFVDLDHFKQINDSFGHGVGDAVLQLAARRLEAAVRHSDTVSRHGGDEFLVLLAEVSQASDAGVIAAKMLAELALPAQLGEHRMGLSASIGIAVYPDDGVEVSTLIARADAAMFHSKRSGAGSFGFYRDAPKSVHGDEFAASASTPPPAGPAAALHPNLCEANEQLVLAALAAQELEAEAREAQRRQVRFLAIVAHELRNPLSPIRSAAELLNRARSDETLLERLQVVIKRQVAHMSRLVDDLLDGSRVTMGRFRLERAKVELTSTLRLAVETCQPDMDKRLQRLTLALPPSPVNVDGDAVRLAQVFSNLLDNASKYTPKGGAITLAMTREDAALAISVRDNGVGISAEALPHIFDLFMQDTHARTLHNGGLGIGLAVVRELVEAHGGSVVASSAGSGLGSDFVVTLPLVEPPV